MSDLNNIVSVSISRETQSVSRAGFGTPAIIAEFATNKTTATFARYREYSSLAELLADGWATSDSVYKAANILLSQNPKVSKFMVGRKDSGDDSWAEALTAIQAASSDWYCFMIVPSNAGTVVFSADFVASNSIAITVNGISVTPVVQSGTQANTMGLLKTAIEADVTGSTVTIDSTDLNVRTLIIEVFGDKGVTSVSAAVTLGASQATAAITYVNEDDYKATAAWVATQKKIFFLASSSVLIKDPSSTSDLAYFLKNLAYDRVVVMYHTAAQGDATPSWIEAGWMGESLPYDPGSQTWAFKTIVGVATYNLTSGERTAILNKNANIYTTTAGVNITEKGQVSSGEYIDIIRGLDWLEARLQEEIFANLINVRKIPFTDAGITLINSIIQGVLKEAARAGVLIEDSIVVTVPAASSVSSADKIARDLKNVTFEAVLQGAIHYVAISGTVTV